MIRATTPKHSFKFPSDPQAYKEILITYQQKGKIILELKEEDLTFGEENTAFYKLSQEQTKKFNAMVPVRIQVRILDADDNAFASSIFSINVHEVLNDEVLVDED